MPDINDVSPMMQNYLETKKAYPDSILFYRIGDFYEMFFDDAVQVSRELELVLTGKSCGMEERAPMCGVPFHAADTYISRLVSKGYKVAICEQVEDPKLAKGLVKREVIKVVTPGTNINSLTLDSGKNNYLMCICYQDNGIGISVVDVSTGEFLVSEVSSVNQINDYLGRFDPSEIICNNAFSVQSDLLNSIKERYGIPVTVLDNAVFEEKTATGEVLRQFKVKSLIGLGLDSMIPGVLAAGASLIYLHDTQKTDLGNLSEIHPYIADKYMMLDSSSRRNLELTETIRDKQKKGSLLGVLDRTKTAMGGRLLRKWIEEPLIVSSSVNARLDAVEECYDRFIERQELIEGLTGLYDIERLASKVSLGSINGREMISLRNSLGKLPFLKECASKFTKGVFREINELLDPLEDIYELLDKAIAEDPPVVITEGDIIKPGYNQECDELRDIASNARDYIMSLEAKEKERTGVKTLKIGYNRVFGYYVEVPRSVTELPPEYTRKQTLANNERYISPELKELEEKILGATSRRTALEYQLFVEVRDTVKQASDRLFGSARATALIDVISSLADLANEENYVRPIVDNSNALEIKDGRHPVVEKMLTGTDRFVPNDTLLDEEHRIMVLTGPNMAGKSTYMRQTAIIVLMAQMGSFVPTSSAHIGLVDKIFTRIGASDDISMGQSTFMVEMKEVAGILKNATASSLLLLDEVGRGTSTYDGLSIAWAVLEYIADPKILYARTIFATHYHELNRLEKSIRGIFNNHVDVTENDDGVVFLHKIVEGGTSDSYGIEVARLAGVPSDVLTRSRNILKELERLGEFKTSDEAELPGQDSIFNPDNVYYRKEDSIRNALRDIDITRVTPLEAMNLLYGFIDTVRKEDQDEQD